MTDNRIADAYKNINISPEAEARIWRELAEENAKHSEKRRRRLWWGLSAALITAAAALVVAVFPGRLQTPADEPETPLASPTEEPALPLLTVNNEIYAKTLSLYERAVKERWDAETLNANGLPSILTCGYNSDGTNSIGYGFTDIDGDGRNELIVGMLPDSENADTCDKLVFAVYAQTADDSIVLCFESRDTELNFWVGGDRFATETYGPDGMPVQTTRRLEDNELIDMTYVTDPADYVRFELVPFTTGETVTPELIDVLDGAEFYLAAEDRYMTIGMSAEAIGILDDTGAVGVYRYCLCDLDADGEKELVLEVSNNGSDDILGYIIVRNDTGKFTGYVSFYRGFNCLKTDGTYSYSNSASCSGTGRAQFTDTVMLTDDLAHTEPRYDDKGNILEQGWFIGGERVTDTEYWAFIDTQNAKENVRWMDINDVSLTEYTDTAPWTFVDTQDVEGTVLWTDKQDRDLPDSSVCREYHGYTEPVEADRVPVDALTGDIREVPELANAQFAMHRPFVSAPWQKTFDTLQQAQDYVGYDGLLPLSGDMADRPTTLTVSVNDKGDILSVRLGTYYEVDDICAQYLAILYTENRQEEIAANVPWTAESLEYSTGVYFTASGNELRWIDSSPLESGYVLMDGYLVENGVLYQLHIAYPQKDIQKAKDLMTGWADRLTAC